MAVACTARAVAGRGVDRHHAEAAALQERARDQQLTTRQVVTLASLVEKETGKGDERPLVAAVYLGLIVATGIGADQTFLEKSLSEA